MKKRSGRLRRSPAEFCERTYRQRVCGVGLHTFQVVCQETDLMVMADRVLERETREAVLAVPWAYRRLYSTISGFRYCAGALAGTGIRAGNHPRYDLRREVLPGWGPWQQ